MTLRALFIIKFKHSFVGKLFILRFTIWFMGISLFSLKNKFHQINKKKKILIKKYNTK